MGDAHLKPDHQDPNKREPTHLDHFPGPSLSLVVSGESRQGKLNINNLTRKPLMDPASLTLGLLGLVGGTLKAATVVRRKLKFFRHYSDEVKRVHKSLTLERHLYNNEIHLLLRSALGDDPDHAVEGLLENPMHDGWKDQSLEQSLRQALGRNHDIIKTVIEELGSTFQSLMLELERFEALTADQSEEVGHF